VRGGAELTAAGDDRQLLGRGALPDGAGDDLGAACRACFTIGWLIFGRLDVVVSVTGRLIPAGGAPSGGLCARARALIN
jgi:hypothetical protein